MTTGPNVGDEADRGPLGGPPTDDRASQNSAVLPASTQDHIANVLEHDAEIMTNTQLEKELGATPPRIKDEIIRINTDARNRALQVALVVPLLAGLLGLLNSFRMLKLPDPKPSEAAEGMLMG